MNEAADATPRARWLRGRRALIGYALLGAVVFVTFLVANFPYSDTVTTMLAPYQLKLVCDDQRLSPPIGAELRGVRLISTAGGDDDAVLDSPAVTLAPTLASLFLGRPGLHVRADLYGGMVKATIGQRAGVTNLSFTLDALDLADGRPLRRFGAVIDGRLSGIGSAVIAGPNIPDNSGRLTLDGRDLSLAIADGFPAVHLGTLTGLLELAAGALRLDGLEAHGADLDLKASGTIQLGATLDDSTIDLTFFLTPTQSGRDHFGFFLRMLPHPPGPNAPYTLQGDLLAPSLS
ncbi:MAG TPA: type II secretion system protein GspN [Candidatus Binataceae bacterium]|nr:type II secretion system protein GspN [Candidatus Binataceae bacterium]